MAADIDNNLLPVLYDSAMAVWSVYELPVQDSGISEKEKKKLCKHYPCKDNQEETVFLAAILCFGMERSFAKRDQNIKRLAATGTDCLQMLVINEARKALTLEDEYFETLIRQTGAQLVVLDPIQGYLGVAADIALYPRDLLSGYSKGHKLHETKAFLPELIEDRTIPQTKIETATRKKCKCYSLDVLSLR